MCLNNDKYYWNYYAAIVSHRIWLVRYVKYIVAPGQLIGSVVDSEPGGTQTVQICGIKMTAERITVSRRIKNVQKNKEIKMTNGQ